MARKNKKKSIPKPPAIKLPVLGVGAKAVERFVDDLAREMGVSAPAMAGMRTAYGWTSQTRMTREAFSEKVRAWLNAGGK